MYAYVLCICLYDMQYVCICVWKLCACVYCGQYVLYNIHMIVCWYACTCKYSCLAFVYMCVKGYVHVCVCTILQVRTMVKASILDENSVWNLMHKRHQTVIMGYEDDIISRGFQKFLLCRGPPHTCIIGTTGTSDTKILGVSTNEQHCSNKEFIGMRTGHS